MNKLVSVIVPAFNHEIYIEETINSIVAQTYENIELIIIDDGSIDGTYKKILELKRSYSDRFSLFYCETQTNQGTCCTLNRALTLCHGDLIAIIASDDMFLPDAISLLVSESEKYPNVGLFVGRNLIMDEHSKVCYWNKKRDNVYSEKEAKWKSFSDYLESKCSFSFDSEIFGHYSSLFYLNYIGNGCLIRRSFIDKVLPFKKESPLEDYWLMLQLSKITKFKYVREDTFIYRWHSTNTAKNLARMIDMQRMTKKNEFEEIAKTLSFDKNLYEEDFLKFRKTIIDLFTNYDNFFSMLKYTKNLFFFKIRRLWR